MCGRFKITAIYIKLLRFAVKKIIAPQDLIWFNPVDCSGTKMALDKKLYP